ncbi:MAG: bifunctional phosphoribosylaminoimidazolecarboxamide formyltransferase/IMP cyclohydrolase [Saprospiraceae bacterium]
MHQPKKVKNALISVYYKDGIENLARILIENDVTIYSTGGTASFLQALGYPIMLIEELTEFPEMLDGRVKTLHPKVFGGILAKRKDEHIEQLQRFNIPEIDLVVVDLYPFEETLSSGASHDEIIEKIDIGGISLIRAAAKNFHDVVILCDKKLYDGFIKHSTSNGIITDLEYRRKLATQAFEVSSCYDILIGNYLIGQSGKSVLRYGENPHQSAEFIGDLTDVFSKISGKELSFNNLVDIDSALNVITDFINDEPTVAILKHTNICGISTRDSIKQAWIDALACDPTSAFGGIIISNSEIDEITAIEINNLFYEVLLAPSFSLKAIELLSKKSNRVLLQFNKDYSPKRKIQKTLLNGTIIQNRDNAQSEISQMRIVTNASPTDMELQDLAFANRCVKHLKSNAITFVKNKQMIGMGCGQTSRIDACRYGIEKANSFGFDLKGSVMASDAFFPFPDCVELAKNAGITAVIQPGGSIKDQLSIDYCDQNRMSMVFTGTRHFLH